MTTEQNIELLNCLKELKIGWNGNRSEPIPIQYIQTCLDHIEKFVIQPIITPFDDGIELRWAIGVNNLVEINVSDDIEFIVTIDDDISVDQVIEAKFISQYANRVLKRELQKI